MRKCNRVISEGNSMENIPRQSPENMRFVDRSRRRRFWGCCAGLVGDTGAGARENETGEAGYEWLFPKIIWFYISQYIRIQGDPTLHSTQYTIIVCLVFSWLLLSS